jgi:hypothetical protein
MQKNVSSSTDINQYEQEKIAWTGLKEIYNLLGTTEGNDIVRILLKQKQPIRTRDLLYKSKLTESKFHPLMKALTLCQVVDKKVLQDRSVVYSISPFGLRIYELSEEMLDKIQKEFDNSDPLLLSQKIQKRIK